MFRLEKKIFFRGTPPSKGKNVLTPDFAWYMFRLEKKFFCRGTPPSPHPPTLKRKFFWLHIWLDTCSDWKKKKFFFSSETPPLVKGKCFDTRFGLIHVQTGKKIVLLRDPPPSKGKIFWHQICLGTCSDWKKKNFFRGTLPPPSKGKNFWHQIWLDTCSDWKKKFFFRGTPPLPPE